MRPGPADALVSEVVGDLPRGQGGGVGPGRDEVAEGVRVQALPFGAGDVIDLRPAEPAAPRCGSPVRTGPRRGRADRVCRRPRTGAVRPRADQLDSVRTRGWSCVWCGPAPGRGPGWRRGRRDARRLLTQLPDHRVDAGDPCVPESPRTDADDSSIVCPTSRAPGPAVSGTARTACVIGPRRPVTHVPGRSLPTLGRWEQSRASRTSSPHCTFRGDRSSCRTRGTPVAP